jgi:hypothetical protein
MRDDVEGARLVRLDGEPQACRLWIRPRRPASYRLRGIYLYAGIKFRLYSNIVTCYG